MHCPHCRHSDTRVLDSRVAEDGASIRRRRQCPRCERRFTTLEQMQLLVVKRSGVVEPFPREKVMRQSGSKADKVIVYPYGGRTADIWWEKIKGSTTRFENLQVIGFSEKDTGALAKLVNRAMKLQINIQDGEVMVSVGDSIVYLTRLKCKHPP